MAKTIDKQLTNNLKEKNMKNKNYEFVTYLPVVGDQYGLLGIGSIRVETKHWGTLEVRYKHIKKKDGSGTFFGCASTTIDGIIKKDYVSAFKFLDPQSAKLLEENLRADIENAIRPQSVYAQNVGEQVYAKPDDNLPF